MRWLYRYETSGIQRWILDSNKLRELKSGSALVEALTARAEQLIADANGEVLQATAGAATARFDSRQQMEAFASEWPMYVRYHAPGLQVIQAWTEDTGGGVQALFDGVSERRNRSWVDLPEAGPWVARAGRSGLPAVWVPEELRRRVPGTGGWDRAMVARAIAEERATQRLDRLLADGWTFEDDLASWGEGPVAVIHLDGSGVGKRLREVGTTADQLRSFSEQLRDATWAATQKALGRLCKRLGPGDRHLRARPIVVGGDDVTILLPAAGGRELAVDWMELFEQETGAAERSSIGGRLHSGAGIVFVHASYPFSMAYELAEVACRDAKRAAVDDRGTPTASVLQFRRVTASLSGGDAAATTWALGGSSRLPDVKALGGLVKACGQLPRGTLRTWLALVDRDDDVGRQVAWNRAREVAMSREPGAEPETGLFPAIRTGTPVRDALALLHLGGRP
jgi:CRISPR RNA silencing complex Cmr2 subunit-like protein